MRHLRHAHQPSPRHQRHQHHRRRRQRLRLTHLLTTINHSPAPTSSTLTPIPLSPTAPPPTQSSTPAPTPPSPPTSPPPPQGQGSRETERQSEHATTRMRRPPYRTPLRNTPPPASPDRACAPAHCWEDDYDVLPAIRHLLAATAPRPQAHQQPTEPQEPDHPMPPRSISPASTADQNAEHQREEPDPERAATPPPPPPPRDIYTTLASTLAPMDAEQYYQSVQRDLPEDHATLQGWKQEKRNDNE